MYKCGNKLFGKIIDELQVYIYTDKDRKDKTRLIDVLKHSKTPISPLSLTSQWV